MSLRHASVPNRPVKISVSRHNSPLPTSHHQSLQSLQPTAKLSSKNSLSITSSPRSSITSQYSHRYNSSSTRRSVARSHICIQQRVMSSEPPSPTLSSSSSSSSGSDSPRLGSKVKVYTKTGDKGTTCLYNMERLPKNTDFFEALGNVDELNSALGMCREYSIQSQNGLDKHIEVIQSRLLDVGSCIATPLSSSPESRIYRTKFDGSNIELLEGWIDEMDQQLPPLTSFILPSGGFCASSFHIARTICRRAERSTVELVQRGDLEDIVMKYLNRLSDYLFMAARFSAQHDGKPETLYKKPTERMLKKQQQQQEQEQQEQEQKQQEQHQQQKQELNPDVKH